MFPMTTVLRFACLFGVVLLAVAARAAVILEGGTANIGQRLFLETRFSRFFYMQSGGDANAAFTNGDPVMDITESIYGPLPGPFAGRAMNCRACHLVQEHLDVGNRTYNDFAVRSPIPANGDGRTVTPRNSPDLIDSLLEHDSPLFLHYDGQFASARDLIIDTLTGRNFGWKPSEYETARAHIIRVIREDNGAGDLAQNYGGWSYAQAFAGGTEIQDAYRIIKALTLNDVSVTNTAATNYISDDRVLDGLAALIEAYLGTLLFSQDLDGYFDGSPYDAFLIKNGLPRGPAANETPLAYSRRLLRQIANLHSPQFVTDPADGHFTVHNQKFQFGPTELEGLRIFFAEPDRPASGPVAGRTGNCIKCHTPPAFTDFLFHNTGATQIEYDSVHGDGAFMALSVPTLGEREPNYDAYLPPTRFHTNAAGTFITPPSTNHPGRTDLGLWNVFLNPDFPAPQPGLRQILPKLLPGPTPRIASATMLDGSFIFSGTNGTPGWNYRVLRSTNLNAAVGGWEIIATNTFDSAGNFSVTNEPSGAQLFFRISAAPSDETALGRMIALFKTPDTRDLTSSEPYFHTGAFNRLPDVIEFYQTVSGLARSGQLRNAAPELSGISLDDSAVVPLVAFLRALDENYIDIPCPCE